MVKAVPAGCPADMGPPLDRQSQDRDGIVVDYFGGHRLEACRGPGLPCGARDPQRRRARPRRAATDRLGLAPFYCLDCGQNYCCADWRLHIERVLT